MQVLEGLIDGSIAIGSRTPVAAAPAWATLEVVTGGFATGNLLAGGPLLEHERQLLAEVSSEIGSLERAQDDDKGRLALNAYHLTEEGMTRLRALLANGCYEIDLPEEGALLVVAWLLERQQSELARDLLDEIGPYFAELRFYPKTVDRPRVSGSRVFLRNVAATLNSLRSIQPNRQILAQKEALEVWAPLYDRTVALLLETVEGEAPRCEDSSERGRQAVVVGGWPCRQFADDWTSRAKAILDEYAAKRKIHRLCGKPDRKKENFYQLRQFLARAAFDRHSLAEGDLARIRLLLAQCVSRRGTPSSSECNELRQRQLRQASGPTHHEIAHVVATRLSTYPLEEGVDDLAPLVLPISAEEARRYGLSDDADVPRSIARKVERCLADSVEELIRRGIVASGDVLAGVLPQMTSQLRSMGIVDPALRRLDAAIYRAFRRRRSLLLLNLESQVRVGELPWMAAIDRFRRRDMETAEIAKAALRELTALAIVSFPQAILPNKLLQEMRALADQAKLDLPLVDELAADIFMGRFSDKFVRAAKRAGQLLAGSLYSTYYEIDFDKIQRLPVSAEAKPRGLHWQAPEFGDAFAQLCRSRAAVDGQAFSVAVNGMVIEQQQILTTQNLAVLLISLDVDRALDLRYADLARRCFNWICQQQRKQAPTWHALLIALKNSAYAWRQMIVYLSLTPNPELDSFLVWADEQIGQQPAEFQSRFRPALEGLRRAAIGQSPEEGVVARRFLGWSTDRHWLLGPKSSP